MGENFNVHKFENLDWRILTAGTYENYESYTASYKIIAEKLVSSVFWWINIHNLCPLPSGVCPIRPKINCYEGVKLVTLACWWVKKENSWKILISGGDPSDYQWFSVERLCYLSYKSSECLLRWAYIISSNPELFIRRTAKKYFWLLSTKNYSSKTKSVEPSSPSSSGKMFASNWNLTLYSVISNKF